MKRVLLIVAINLEYHGLALHVLDEGPGDSHRDVLHMVEVQGCPFPIIFQWFCREGLIMTVDKAGGKKINSNFKKTFEFLLELREYVGVFRCKAISLQYSHSHCEVTAEFEMIRKIFECFSLLIIFLRFNAHCK